LPAELVKYGLVGVALVGVLVLMSGIFAVLRCICGGKAARRQEKPEMYEE